MQKLENVLQIYIIQTLHLPAFKTTRRTIGHARFMLPIRLLCDL